MLCQGERITKSASGESLQESHRGLAGIRTGEGPIGNVRPEYQRTPEKPQTPTFSTASATNDRIGHVRLTATMPPASDMTCSSRIKWQAKKLPRVYFFFSLFCFRFSFGLRWAFFCCSFLPLSFFPLSPISDSPCLKVNCVRSHPHPYNANNQQRRLIRLPQARAVCHRPWQQFSSANERPE